MLTCIVMQHVASALHAVKSFLQFALVINGTSMHACSKKHCALSLDHPHVVPSGPAAQWIHRSNESGTKHAHIEPFHIAISLSPTQTQMHGKKLLQL